MTRDQAVELVRKRWSERTGINPTLYDPALWVIDAIVDAYDLGIRDVALQKTRRAQD